MKKLDEKFRHFVLWLIVKFMIHKKVSIITVIIIASLIDRSKYLYPILFFYIGLLVWFLINIIKIFMS